MHTVVARFHHLSRDLGEIEEELVEHGADAAQITGYTVAITLDTESHREAADEAKRILDSVGATRVKITKHRVKPPKAERV